jgi:hypothetical protein
MEHDSVAFQTVAALSHHLGQSFVERVSEGDVGDHAGFKEGERSNTLGAVDDLVRDNKVARFHGFLEGADGGKGDDGANAEGAEGGDVGAGRDFMRGELVVCPVAREEGDGDRSASGGGGVFEDVDVGGRVAPGCRDGEGGSVGEVG